MGLLGMMLAGGVAEASKSVSGSIDQNEKMAYAQMLETSRQQHQEHLAELQNQWATERDKTQFANTTERDKTQFSNTVDRDKAQFGHAELMAEKQHAFRLNSMKAESEYKDANTNVAFDNTTKQPLTQSEVDSRMAEGKEDSFTYQNKLEVDKHAKSLDLADAQIYRQKSVGAFEDKNSSITPNQQLQRLEELREAYNAEMLSFDDGKREGNIIGYGKKDATKTKPSFADWVKQTRPESYELLFKSAKNDPQFDNVYDAVAQAESSGNHIDPKTGKVTISKKGAIGKFQLLEDTAKDLGVDPYDEKQNEIGGRKYLDQLLGKYNGDRDLALAAFNHGMGNVDAILKKGGSIKDMPLETRNFVAKVNGMIRPSSAEKGGDVGTALASAPTNPIPMPKSKNELAEGQVYATPRGDAIWKDGQFTRI